MSNGEEKGPLATPLILLSCPINVYNGLLQRFSVSKSLIGLKYKPFGVSMHDCHAAPLSNKSGVHLTVHQLKTYYTVSLK